MYINLNRLGRNLKHLIQTVEDLTKRKIGFKVLSGQGVNIDTSVTELCKELKITRATLYKYISPTGELRDYIKKVLEK